nr:hypothetical protein [uncultured Desulfuromonas sp.]
MALAGFDKQYYLEQKLAALQAVESEWNTKTVADLEATLDNVFGLTAEEHYQQYGWAEGLAPNQYFNAEEYKLAKAEQLFDQNLYLSVEDAVEAFETAWQQDPYLHYLQYGAGESINPSNAFDASQYFADKLADLQAEDPETYADWTAEDVQNAFLDAGLTAIQHYVEYGMDEGLTITAVPEDEQVDAGDTTPTEGETFTLTTGIDDFTGTAGNDTFIAEDVDVSGTQVQTFKALDSIDGGDGTDTFTIYDQTSAISATTANVANVETVNVKGAAAVTVTSTGWTGLESLNVQQAGGAVTLTAASTTDVTATGLGDFATTIASGKSATVTQKMDAAGDSIVIDKVGDVTVTATDSAAAAGGIAIGGTTAVTGEVNVTSTSADIVGGTGAVAMDTIAVTGGTTVNVTQDANSVSGDVATAAIVTDVVTQGAVTVIGGNATTTVNVVQDDQVTAKAAAAGVDAVKQTQTVTFTAMGKGDDVTVNGLTFTASKALTAQEVAQAFENLTAADTQDDGGPTANGYYTGSFNTLAFTSGAAEGATVTLSEVTAGTNAALVATAFTDAGGDSTITAAPTVAAGVAGVAKTPAVTGVAGVVNGAVVIDDNATASITDITVDGYSAGATLGGGAPLDALTSLTLKNSGAGGATVDTDSTGSLALTLDDVDGTVNLDTGGATLTGLTINTEGVASTGAITAAAATSVTINAEANLSGASTFTAATAFDINGSAKVDLTGATTNAATLETINAADNTGGVTVVLGATNAVAFTGGSGKDSLTLGNTAIATGDNIDMGAGDDTLAIAAGTTATTIVGSVTGGDGTDTLSMGYADAINTALSASTAFDAEVLGFERLLISDVATDNDAASTTTFTVDLANLTYDYVTVNGTADADEADTLALTNMAANSTVAFGTGVGTNAGNDVYTVALADATGTADSINYVLASTNETSATKVADNTPGTANNAGTITADAIETFNISSTAVDADGATNVITANGNAVTSINISGNAGVNLTSTATTLKAIDASALTAGGLTFSAANSEMVIDGGAGIDTISIAATADKADVSGGEGKDVFNIAAGADLVTIDGGAGADTFNFAGASTNKSNYTVIEGVDSGDTFVVTGATSFSATEITLAQGATESTQAYLDQAMTDLGANALGWFQYNGNTFIAADLGADSANSFADGTDGVIMLTGLVDLSTASFNVTSGALEIA